jgi:4-amino-4-deoxy-L-arabinose transferase-like glycosyltransferase
VRDPWRRGWLGILGAQLVVYALRLTDGFYDGRQHVNWGPPFWLMRAVEMHKVSFWSDGYASAVMQTAATPDGWRPTVWYLSHPQLISVAVYLWTGLFGYAEWAARSLTSFVTILTALALWLAAEERHGARRATLFVGAWAALPMVIVYGRNLEHVAFVTLFLAVAALGHEKARAGKPGWRWCWAAGIVGLLWSDWFGWPIAALFFAAQALVERQLLWETALAGAAGSALVLAQVALPHAASQSAAGVAVDGHGQSPTRYLWEQYHARSGHGAPLGAWLRRQVQYWSVNFAPGAGVLALVWGLGAQARGFARKRDGLSLRELLFLGAAGNLAYALVVRDASSVHLFYQYPYGPWVAWELAALVERLGAATARRAVSSAAWAALVGALLYRGLTLLYVRGWGGPAETALLKLIKTYPPEATVSVIASPEDNWLAMPNVEYYSGRRIWNAYPEDAVKKDLVLLPPGDPDRQKAALDYLAGPRWRFLPRACAPSLCLWERKPS